LSTIPLSARHAVGAFVVCVAALLSACNSDSSSASAAPAGRTQTTAASRTVDYAAVATLSLQAAGLPETLTLAQIEVTSGVAKSLRVQDGEIRFLTPSDTGVDSTVVLKVALADSDITLPIVVRSARPTAVVTEIEPDADGVQPASAKSSVLTVTGLGAGNVLDGTALRFSVAGAPALDRLASSATVFVPQTGATLNLAKDWTLDAATNTLTVPADKVAALLAALPSGEVAFDIGLTSVDGEFAVAWTFLAHTASTTLQGRVVGLDGVLQTSAAGQSVAVRGLDNRTRLVTVVDASGAFSAGPLGAGTYELSLLDTNAPGFWTASVPIFPNSSTVSADLVYAPSTGAGKAKSGSVNHPTSSQGSPSLARVQQNGIAPRPRTPPNTARAATPAGCETLGLAGEARYQAEAGTQNNTVGCVVAYTVPAGTAKVSVDVTVFTEEYPTYTTAKSQYNDTWAYALTGLSGIGAASGSVNDTHYTQGTVTKHFCVDVASATASAPLVLNANLAATNIGDSVLPTTVTLAFKLSCTQELKVTGASFDSPNAKGYAVLKPLTGNLPGNYISLPITTAVADWGLPLAVQYEPKEATITKVRVGVMVDGSPVMADTDLVGSITSQSAGKLTFANLVMPRIPNAMFAGKTNVLIELTGTVSAEVLTSKPEDGQITFDGKTTFVPLFLAGDALGEARRYGQSPPLDAGLDSWSTFNTVAWLQSKLYRFNDVSGLHIAQDVSTQRSVLDHTGHSDGTQIDLRYADGSGGYTETLGGSSNGSFIQAMLNAAAAEVTAGGTGAKPNLTKAIAWIQANRSMLESESANARKLHAGPSWMKLALADGKLPNGVLVPGIAADGALVAGMGPWTTKPANLSFVAPHLHHWHISLKAI
jgi:hypothetical protein